MSHHHATLYVVDQDPEIRRALIAAARSEQAGVELHRNAAECLEALRAEEPGCAVLDIDAMDAGAYPTLDFVCQRRGAVALVALSARATASLAVRTLKAGAFDFVEKPCALSALAETARAGLRFSHETLQQRCERAAFEKRFGELTARQQEILRHLVLGKPNKAIAFELGISERTVEVHRYRLLRRMSVGSAVELARLVGAFA
jgi:FixJ family two-component response regulator